MAGVLVDVLLERLATLALDKIEQEMKLVVGVKQEIKNLTEKLEAIHAVLEDAEQRQEMDAGVKLWLNKLNDVSFDMDDVLDEWITKVLRSQLEKQEKQSSKALVTNKKKMGMKEDNNEVTLKTRILSLELLQGLLEGVGHPFTRNFHFIDSVKAYLSYALLRASVSPSPVIFQYATGIFLVLLLRFRESLKGEIGIFFPLIVLRSLDGSDPMNQKMSVLRMGTRDLALDTSLDFSDFWLNLDLMGYSTWFIARTGENVKN